MLIIRVLYKCGEPPYSQFHLCTIFGRRRPNSCCGARGMENPGGGMQQIIWSATSVLLYESPEGCTRHMHPPTRPPRVVRTHCPVRRASASSDGILGVSSKSTLERRQECYILTRVRMLNRHRRATVTPDHRQGYM